MTQSQRELVDEKFGELIELDSAARAEALAAIENEEVRAEVASLLQHLATETHGLHTPIEKMMREASVWGAFAGQSAEPGTRFERYRIQRKIGHGGMGDVYEATRENDFHKRVALKIVRFGLDSEFARGRFQQERQTLAGLEHPYIARLLDGGEAENGSPYLVLEFVDGSPIDEYCKGKSKDEILALFLKVCDAVEYAHRNLVIHRDLKPANILVTTEGDPKLLDFGIAKLLDPTADATQTGFAALTPQYASPEQVRGEPITTASDVYALGVILYQLLTGNKPYQVTSTTALEMDRVICHEPPSPPQLGDELDDILLMALRKEPERRYRTAFEMAQDIERYREGRPVLATPDSFSYRTRKYITRHWVGIAAVTFAVLALVIGAGVATYQAYIAKQRFQQVRTLANTFLFQFHDQIVDVPGTAKARAFVVQTGQKYLDTLAKSAGNDPTLQAELAQSYKRIGDAQGLPRASNLGDRKGAEASYLHSISIYESLLKRHPEYTSGAVDSWSTLSMVYLDEHRTPEAHHALERAQALAPALEHQNTETALRSLAHLYQVVGENQFHSGLRAEYIVSERQSVDALEAWSKIQKTVTPGTAQSWVGVAHSRLGKAYGAASEFPEAEVQFKAAQVNLDNALKADPMSSFARDVYITNTSNLAALYGSNILPSMERYSDAAAAQRLLMAKIAPLLEADEANLLLRNNYVKDMLGLAYYLSMVNSADGLPEAKQALAIWEARQPGATLPTREQAAQFMEMRKAAQIFAAHGLSAQAKTLAAQITEGHRTLLAKTPPTDDEWYYVVGDLQAQAEVAAKTGDRKAADAFYADSLKVGAPFLPDAGKTVHSAYTAGQLYDSLMRNRAATGRCAEAEQWRKKQVDLWAPLAGTNPFATAHLHGLQALQLSCTH